MDSTDRTGPETSLIRLVLLRDGGTAPLKGSVQGMIGLIAWARNENPAVRHERAEEEINALLKKLH